MALNFMKMFEVFVENQCGHHVEFIKENALIQKWINYIIFFQNIYVDYR